MFDERSSKKPTNPADRAIQEKFWECQQLCASAFEAAEDMQLGSAQRLVDNAIREADATLWPDQDMRLVRAEARLCAAEIAAYSGSLPEAIQYLGEAIVIRVGLKGEGDSDVYACTARRGELYTIQGQFAQAASDWQNVIEWAEKANDKQVELLAARLGHSRVLRAVNRAPEASFELVQAFNILPRLNAEQSHEAALLLRSKSEEFLKEGEFELSFEMSSIAIQCLEKSREKDCGFLIDEFALLRAKAAACQGKLEEATTTQDSILSRWTAELGESHEAVIALRADKGWRALEDGHFVIAEQLLRSNYEVATAAIPALLAQSAEDLAVFYRTIGYGSKGSAILNQACEAIPAENLEERLSLTRLAASLELESGRVHEAISKYQWALSQVDNLDVKDCLLNKVDLLIGLSAAVTSQDPEKGAALLDEADILLDQLPPIAHDEMLVKLKHARRTITVMSGDLEKSIDPERAEKELQEFERYHGQSRNFTRAHLLRDLAYEYLTVGDTETGLEKLDEARQLLEGIGASSSRVYAFVLLMLADTLPDWDEMAKNYRAQAHEILRRYRGVND